MDLQAKKRIVYKVRFFQSMFYCDELGHEFSLCWSRLKTKLRHNRTFFDFNHVMSEIGNKVCHRFCNSNALVTSFYC